MSQLSFIYWRACVILCSVIPSYPVISAFGHERNRVLVAGMQSGQGRIYLTRRIYTVCIICDDTRKIIQSTYVMKVSQ